MPTKLPAWPRPAKIAFIGSHGIRKTSALLAFAAEAQRAGRSVELGREVVRDNPLGINEGATGEAQLWVLVTQIRQELELARKADILATDRGVMDNFAYYLRSCGGTDEYAVEPLVRRWSATYDLVVRLLPDVALQADGVRSTNDAFRDEVEAILDRRAARPRAGRPPGHAPRVRDHEPVRLVRGAPAAGGGRSGRRWPRPTSGADARRPRPLAAAATRPRPAASRSAVDSASAGHGAASSGSIVTWSTALPSLAVDVERRRRRAVARRRQARAASARTAPPRPGATARRSATSRSGPATTSAGQAGRAPSRRARGSRSASVGAAPATGRARPSRRAAGSAARGSGDDEDRQPDPAALAAQPPLEVGRRERDSRAARRRGGTGPDRPRPVSTAARRASRGSSRSMFIANASSATASSQRPSRPSDDRPERLERPPTARPAGAARRPRGRGPAAARRPPGGTGA